jgi:hypothetical protein
MRKRNAGPWLVVVLALLAVMVLVSVPGCGRAPAAPTHQAREVGDA